MISQQAMLDNMNFWGDSRVQAKMKDSEDYEEVNGEIFRVIGCEEDDDRLLLPCKLEDCDTCYDHKTKKCKGTHVNPSIDAGGLSEDDFAQDPDFAKGYFGGRYDVTCYQCRGVKKVLAVDYDNLDDAAKKLWNDHCQEEYYDRQVSAAELRFGC